MEEHRLRVFENRVLRRMFGPKRDKIAGGWRKLNNEALHNLYSSPYKMRIMKSSCVIWAGHVARFAYESSAYCVLVGKSGEKTPIRRPRLRWKDNTKMYLIERG
jgi:hypothetical protein